MDDLVLLEDDLVLPKNAYSWQLTDLLPMFLTVQTSMAVVPLTAVTLAGERSSSIAVAMVALKAENCCSRLDRSRWSPPESPD